MTAPIAPQPHPVFWIIIAVMICFAIVLPFSRRDDWLGWVAIAVIAAANVVLWGVLLWGLARAVWQRVRR